MICYSKCHLVFRTEGKQLAIPPPVTISLQFYSSLSSFFASTSRHDITQPLTQRITLLLSLLSPYYMPISCTKWYKKVSNAITLVRTF